MIGPESSRVRLLNWVVQLAALATGTQAAILMVEDESGTSPVALFGAQRLQVQGWLTVPREWVIVPDVWSAPDGHALKGCPLNPGFAACAPIVWPSEGILASLWVLSQHPRPRGLSKSERDCLELLTKIALEPLLTYYASGCEPGPAASARVAILVADDEPVFRQAAKLEFSGAGFAVTEAQSGRQVLRLVSENQPDVLVIDLAMPDGEGIETIRTLREEGYSGIIVAVSGAFPSPLLRTAELLGANACLKKPFTKGALSSLVAGLLVTSWGNATES